MLLIISKRKSVGFDKVAAETFIQNSDWVSNILKHIFNTVKYTNKLPNDWLNWIVTFIFKKLPKYNIDNYRPLAITNIVYKILETVITNRSKPYMNILTAYKIGRSDIDVP